MADLGQGAVGEGQAHADEHVAAGVDPHHQEARRLDIEEHREAAADFEQFGALRKNNPNFSTYNIGNEQFPLKTCQSQEIHQLS